MYWGPSIEQDYMKETRELAQAPADQVVPHNSWGSKQDRADSAGFPHFQVQVILILSEVNTQFYLLTARFSHFDSWFLHLKLCSILFFFYSKLRVLIPIAYH